MEVSEKDIECEEDFKFTEVYKTPIQMFDEGIFVQCSAPMVRYSKLAYRLLCKKWGCNLTFTPMIVSKDFLSSPFARDTYLTETDDRPLVVQFAASNANDLAAAAEKVAKYCDAIDLNCGCPQRWVVSEGYGSGLLTKPDLIRDMVRQTKERCNKPVSIKIRVDNDMKNTIELVKRAEAVGCNWITVHGRTPKTRSSHPVDIEAIKLVKENLNIPVMANGDIFTLQDALDIKAATKVNGVMAARGVLQNPAIFKGYATAPLECIEDWLYLSTTLGLPFHNIHQLMMLMLFPIHNRIEKREFNTIKSFAGMMDYFSVRGVDFSLKNKNYF